MVKKAQRAWVVAGVWRYELKWDRTEQCRVYLKHYIFRWLVLHSHCFTRSYQRHKLSWSLLFIMVISYLIIIQSTKNNDQYERGFTGQGRHICDDGKREYSIASIMNYFDLAPYNQVQSLESAIYCMYCVSMTFHWVSHSTLSSIMDNHIYSFCSLKSLNLANFIVFIEVIELGYSRQLTDWKGLAPLAT